MTPEEFAKGVLDHVVERGTNIYREQFNNPDKKRIKDGFFLKAHGLFNELNNEQRELFVEILRVVQVDTVSAIFSILDGSSVINGYKGDYLLQYFDSEVSEEVQDRLNKYLQDTFLEIEEENR